MGSIDFRLTEIISYVNVLRNRYHRSGGDGRPPFGGLHYVRGEKMIRTRSNFLVHWTGRGLLGCETAEGIQQHVERLASIYREGLHLSVPRTADSLRSVSPNDVDLPHLPCICFTELRIRNAVRFASDYGTMGIGFRREYLMKKGANPVFYLQSARSGIVNTNMSQLRNIVKPKFISAAEIILAYCKPMNRICEEDLVYYEEHEWRIVQASGGIPLPSEFKQDTSGGRMSFHFDPAEVQVIILPNPEVRAKALAHGYLSDVFKTRIPMMLDYDACSEL
jgi:hypothetical protein